MVDQVNKGEDEYQLSEDNKFNQDPVKAGKISQLGNVAKSVKTKRFVLFSIGALIILLALYEFAGFFISEKNDDSNTQTVEQVQTPAMSDAQLDRLLSGNMNEDRLTEVEREISLRENEINSIIVSLSSIQHSFADLGDQIGSLQKNINTLSQQAVSQQAMIVQLQEEEKKAQEDDRIIYHIQAIIPGRAWLKGSDGSTLTVRAGSEIPDYGTVSMIDVNQAIIKVNTGEVIGYDPNDS